MNILATIPDNCEDQMRLICAWRACQNSKLTKRCQGSAIAAAISKRGIADARQALKREMLGLLPYANIFS